MYKYKRLSCFALLLLLSACSSGLMTGHRGHYYHTSLADDFASRNINKVAIFVFSNGEPRDMTLKFSRYYSDSIVRQINQSGTVITSDQEFNQRKAFGSINASFDIADFVDEVTTDMTLYPDVSATQASLEFAGKIKHHLDSIGYKTEIIENLGHSGIIPAGNCIDFARNHNFDAAFIAYYTPIKKWAKVLKYEERDTINNAKVQDRQLKIYKGFLYLPNAAMFDTRKNDLLWQSSYYGVVENAHISNISGQSFIKIIYDALAGQGGESYMEASEKAACMLFNPERWRKSFIPVPMKQPAH